MGVPTRYTQIQADAFLGSALDNSPFGKVWYVDGTNGADGNAGDGPNAGEAFATIGAAITASVATRGDTIIIYPGTYTVTAALAPKAFTTFRAAIINPYAPSVSIRGNIANLVTVDVNGVRFIGLEFRPTGTTARDLVSLAATTAITGGCLFEDCVFNGNNQNTSVNGVAGLRLGFTNATTGLIVRRCAFRDLGKTPMEVGASGMPFAKIEDNFFQIGTPSGFGIRLEDTTAFATGAGYTIRNNEFLGDSATTANNIGISIVGTLNTTAAGMIRNNYFSFCATASITQGRLSQGVIENYRGEGNGGVLIDQTA